jgi:hypothetical protein
VHEGEGLGKVGEAAGVAAADVGGGDGVAAEGGAGLHALDVEVDQIERDGASSSV